MKNFCLIIVVLSCFITAYLIKRFYNQKNCFYKDFCTFCDYIKNNISANNEKINIVLNKDYCIYSKEFKKILNLYQAYLNKELDFNNYVSNTKNNLFFLNNDEKEEVISFFKYLGLLTKEEEIANIDNKKIYWKIKLDDFLINKKKLGELFFKLFIILGIAVFIIFI